MTPGRITVNFGVILQILDNHLNTIADQTGILSRNGIIVDAVCDYIRTHGGTLTDEERVAIAAWCPRVGTTWSDSRSAGR